MMSVGDVLPLTIEKPVAGGRMIARLDGRIVLVSGAIPGERVHAREHGGVEHQPDTRLEIAEVAVAVRLGLPVRPGLPVRRLTGHVVVLTTGALRVVTGEATDAHRASTVSARGLRDFVNQPRG